MNGSKCRGSQALLRVHFQSISPLETTLSVNPHCTIFTHHLFHQAFHGSVSGSPHVAEETRFLPPRSMLDKIIIHQTSASYVLSFRCYRMIYWMRLRDKPPQGDGSRPQNTRPDGWLIYA